MNENNPLLALCTVNTSPVCLLSLFLIEGFNFRQSN